MATVWSLASCELRSSGKHQGFLAVECRAHCGFCEFNRVHCLQEREERGIKSRRRRTRHPRCPFCSRSVRLSWGTQEHGTIELRYILSVAVYYRDPCSFPSLLALLYHLRVGCSQVLYLDEIFRFCACVRWPWVTSRCKTWRATQVST